MNNEEKILEMLGQLQLEVASLKGNVSSLKESQEDMKGSIAEMQATLTKVAVTQENIVLPRLQLLAEGHNNLLDKLDSLAPKSRVEALEDDVALMKTAIRTLSQEVAELKKAQ